jgi:hypothetical protein
MKLKFKKCFTDRGKHTAVSRAVWISFKFQHALKGQLLFPQFQRLPSSLKMQTQYGQRPEHFDSSYCPILHTVQCLHSASVKAPTH